jgi:hypothetical protein
VTNGTTDDVKVNACIFRLGDRPCTRIHVSDIVRNSSFAGDSAPFTGVTVSCIRKATILIDDEWTYSLIDRHLPQKVLCKRTEHQVVGHNGPGLCRDL